MTYRNWTLFLCGVLFATRAQAERADFTHDVQPLLIAKCKACHGGDKRSGGFTIREYNEMLHGGRSGASVIPGDAKQSLLLRRVNGEQGPTMPLGGGALTARELSVIQSWIEDGARLTADAPPARMPWMPKLALTAPPLPDSNLAHPIDRFLARYYEDRKLPMPSVVNDATFARRAYLDSWGLLPAPADLEAFVKSTDPNKRTALIDRLLADNRNYTEHWISYWNDLLRNDGGDSYHGGRKSINEWLYRALDTNLPYNQFVQQLLNPDKPGLPDGFLMGVNWRGDVNASQTPTMQAAQNSAQIFLGINLKCNSCHDSFISRWKLKDAYGLAAYFSENQKLELVRCDNPTGQFTTASFLYPDLNTADVPDSLSERHALAAKLFTDPRNGRTPRTLVNRYWARLLGRGIVADVDDMDAEPWNPELLDWLAGDFVAHGYDLKHLLRTIMTSRAYQMPPVRRESSEDKEYLFRGPEFRRITAEEFIDAIGAITGEWQVVPEAATKAGRYSRDWRTQSSNLSRALGRPIRDQVFTSRDCSATTLQALELVNGSAITHLINRGAQRMLGQLKPSPENRFDSGRVSSQQVAVNIDVTNLNELHLVISDVDSYSPERVLAVWADPRVEKNGVWMPLAEAAGPAVQMKGASFQTGLRAAVPSQTVLDLRGQGYTRFRVTVGVEQSSLQSDISPNIRFFIFGEKPDLEHLVKVGLETPVTTPQPTSDRLRDLWMQVLGREPTAAERKLALPSLSTSDGLADLLWSLFMLPEFQLIG